MAEIFNFLALFGKRRRRRKKERKWVKEVSKSSIWKLLECGVF